MKLSAALLILLGIASAFAGSYTRVAQNCHYSYWNTQTCLDCLANCSCSSYKGCDTITCASGMTEYLFNGNKVCASCPRGCTKCTATAGQKAKFPNLEGFTCTECYTTCDKTIDSDCSEPLYQLISGVCVELDDQSSSPQPNQPYFDLPKTSTTTITTNSPQICIEYDEKTATCKTCPEGSFLNELRRCEGCVDGCQKCDSRGTCQTCQSGTFWKPDQNPASSSYRGSGACAQCPELTATCDATGLISLTCIQGAYLENKKCLLCSVNCSVCSSAACTTCETGYFLESGKCIYCFGNDATKTTCSSCKTGKATSCDVCDTDYTPLLNQCQKCDDVSPGCAECGEVSNTVSCNTCSNGYYKQVDANTKVATCILCTLVNQQAQLCYKDDTSVNQLPPVITQCNKDYWLVKTTAGSLTCVDGKDLNCNLMVDESGKCKDCVPGYQLLNGQCVNCNSPNNGCTLCKVESDKFICTACSDNNPLEPNYVLLTTTNLCSKCNDNCLQCQTDLTCKSCKDGYVLNAGQCNQCVTQNCATCLVSSLNTCVVCQSGFYLFTDTDKTTSCYACPQGCSKCGTTGQKCTECLTEYYLKADGCFLSPVYCAKVNTDGSCSECQYAYRLAENGQCLPCIDFQGGYVCGENAGQECSAWISKSLSFVILLLTFAFLQ